MGMNPWDNWMHQAAVGLPRAHGDEPSLILTPRARAISAPYIRGYLSSQKKHRSMDGTKIFMTFAMKSVAPELPYLEQDNPPRTQQRPFFCGFYQKVLSAKKIHSQPGPY